MKKLLPVLLATLIAAFLSGCSGTPSDEKIKAALDDGTITVDDAKEKGWIDDAWIRANFETIEAESKIYLFDAFETTYLDGSSASSKLIAGKMCLVFFNTEEEDTMEKLEVFKDAASEMEEISVPILGIITDKDPEAAREKLKDIPFPVIVYNEEMQASLAKQKEMLDSDVVSVFTKEGGFYSAWSTKSDKEGLLDFARDLADEE